MKWRRVVTVLLLCLVALEVARSLARLDRVIFAAYVDVGDVVLQGGDPYGPRFTTWPPLNTWPPFFLFIAAGLALLARISLVGTLLLWQVGCVAAIWGACRLLARLVDEEPPPFASAATLVPVLMTARLFQEHLQHTQVNLYVFLLVLVAFLLFRRRRDAWGGLALAAAASAKVMPIVFLPYLLYKRAWRAAAWTAGFLVVLNVAVPFAVFGPARTAQHWRAWRSVAAAETADPTPHHMNQSLLAALKRLLTAEGSARDPVHYAVAAWPTQRAVTGFYLLAGLGALGLALAFRRHPPGLDAPPPTLAAELAVCLAAMTLVSPLAWKAHFVTVLPAYWWAWRGLSGRMAWGVWWGSFACLTLSAPALVGERINNVLESLNVITVGALLVLALALWVGLKPLPPQPPASSARHSAP